MTAELAFAKSFLSSLDAKPIKIAADYAADRDTLELKGPYTLARMPNAMEAPDRPTDSAGAAPAVDVLLKSLRNPPLNLTLTAQSLTVSILELKQKVAAEVGLEGTDKVRLLYNKKPCSDSKSLKDVLAGAGGRKVEFSVMVIGGVPAKAEAGEAMASVESAVDPDVEDRQRAVQLLRSEEFWADLRGFLEQRLKNSAVAHDAAVQFRKAYNAPA